jgi:hypothetical protein
MASFPRPERAHKRRDPSRFERIAALAQEDEAAR